jgi:hypothetical protein
MLWKGRGPSEHFGKTDRGVQAGTRLWGEARLYRCMLPFHDDQPFSSLFFPSAEGENALLLTGCIQGDGLSPPEPDARHRRSDAAGSVFPLWPWRIKRFRRRWCLFRHSSEHGASRSHRTRVGGPCPERRGAIRDGKHRGCSLQPKNLVVEKRDRQHCWFRIR